MLKLRDLLVFTGVLFLAVCITYAITWLLAMVGCMRFINPLVIFYGSHWSLIILRIFLILEFIVLEVFGVTNILSDI